MVTRQTISRNYQNGLISFLPSGYEKNLDTPQEFFIPSCGFSDVDEAVYNLFNKDIGFSSTEFVNKTTLTRYPKPTVNFATGERFAIIKKSLTRDNNEAPILPIISISKKNFTQSSEDLSNRGINQMTGTLVWKRRLSPEDKTYQYLLNRQGLINRSTQQTSSSMPQGELKDTINMKQGLLLDDSLNFNNLFEEISIPSPQFYTVNYEITFWTTHIAHMNYLLETFMRSYLPQFKGFVVECEKGYNFIAETEEEFNNEDNIEELDEEKKLIRYTFSLNVKAFLLFGSDKNNEDIPVKRRILTPIVNFEVFDTSEANTSIETKQNPYSLTDVTTTNQQERTTKQHLYQEKILNGKQQKIFITDQNKRKGETVYSAENITSLIRFLNPD
jgi:hypothetical protein